MKTLLLTLFALSLTACATTTPEIMAGKSLLAMQSTIITVASTGSTLCNQGVLTKGDCEKIADYYAKAAPAYDLAADSMTMLLLKNTPEAWQQYNASQTAFRTLFDGLLKVAAQFPQGGK